MNTLANDRNANTKVSKFLKNKTYTIIFGKMKKALKIAHYYEGRCNPEGAGGVDLTVGGLCGEQGKKGHDVLVVCTSPKEPYPIGGAKVENFPPGRTRFGVSKALFDRLHDFSPDVIHFHSNYIPRCSVIARWATKNKIPYVVTPNGNCSTRLLSDEWWIKRPYRLLVELPYLNKATFVHSVGDGDEIRKYGVTVPMIETLNGFDMSSIPSNLDADVITKALPELNDYFVILYLGRLHIEQKGLDLLLEALATRKKKKNNGKVALVLVGTDWQGSEERMKEMRKKLGIEDQVHFWGPAYNKEKFDLLYAADLFIHTSRWEGMSFAVAEALAVNGYCLLTPPADPGGLVSTLNAGIISGETVEGISTAIDIAVSETAEEKEATRQRARTLVSERMSWEKIAQTVEQGYYEYLNVH